MSHYYTNDATLTSDIKKISYTYRGKNLIYNVDNGIFSKERVDFGTNVLLNSLPVFPQNSKILDVGCGYGPIGLAISKSNESYSLEMIDVNKRAIEMSTINKILNGIENAIIYESNVYENVTNKFNYIITNPPIRAGKEVVLGILLGAKDYLEDGGEVYCVIQKKQGAPSTMIKMKQVYGNCDVVSKEKGYFVFKSKK